MESQWFGGRTQGRVSPLDEGGWVFDYASHRASFKTEEEAHAYLLHYNQEHNLIRNRVRCVTPEIMEMELTRRPGAESPVITIFDTCDYPKIRNTYWIAVEFRGRLVVQSSQDRIWLHRVLFGSKKARHKTENALDNRRSNLSGHARTLRRMIYAEEKLLRELPSAPDLIHMREYNDASGNPEGVFVVFTGRIREFSRRRYGQRFQQKADDYRKKLELNIKAEQQKFDPLQACIDAFVPK